MQFDFYPRKGLLCESLLELILLYDIYFYKIGMQLMLLNFILKLNLFNQCYSKITKSGISFNKQCKYNVNKLLNLKKYYLL